MKGIIHVNRRDFLKSGILVGGGLMLGCYLPDGRSIGEASSGSGATFMPNAFIRIGSDDRVTIIVNKSEMGQGVYTSLPMIVAEELEVDWTKIKVEAAPVDQAYNHTQWGIQGTGGSTSVWSEWERLQKVGATARWMLIQAAADIWKVEPTSCRAEKGFVIHDATKRRISYGKLTEKANQIKVPKDIPLKEPKDFKLIGKSMKRLDTPDKTSGKTVFGIDAKIPGMLIAVVARPPVFGGKIKSFKADKAKAIPGVKEIIQVDSSIAIIADGFWSANKGREALEIVWDEGPIAGLSTEGMREKYARIAKTPGAVVRKEGDAQPSFSKASKQLSAEYEVPFLAHACMEPLNCLVDLHPDRCDIWTGTQMQTVDRNAAARVAGLKPEQVKIHTAFLGGGFGRRANPHSDFVAEAVSVAKMIKKPVKVIWTREDDMKGGYYRPMWYDRIAAGLDDQGKLIAWQHTMVGQSILSGTPFDPKKDVDPASVEGAGNIPYEIPNIFVDLHSPKIGIPVLWWRSVGHSHTAFVVESFIDEVAHAAGKDPYEFRRKLLTKHPRHVGVLQLAAEKAGWGNPLPKGHGRGIAVHESFGSFVAQVAEVSIVPSGQIRVHKVVCAIDCGRIVNPDIIKAQMESGVVFGLSAVLHGEITFKNGRVDQHNFHDYPILRMSEMPVVDVYIVPSEEKSGGVGEPGVPPIAPAVCNAICSVTGKRIRRLPIRSIELTRS